MSLWGVTAFFNPTGSAVRARNLERFAKGVRGQGLKLLVVELAYGEPEVKPEWCDGLVILRGGAVCWQKERLLNVGTEALPPWCNKVAWLDADLVFDNDDWVEETGQHLDRFPVVQPFTSYVRQEWGENSLGMAASQPFSGECEGHPGFAWAARRDILSGHGLYDKCVIGGGDTIISWASFGLRWPGFNRCGYYFSLPHLADIERWSLAWHRAVKGQVGFVSGVIGHLPHDGPRVSRQYEERLLVLKDANFDPARDIINDGGRWVWNSPKPLMHARVERYFEQREKAA